MGTLSQPESTFSEDTEEPLFFQNNNGQMLYGIAHHSPDQGQYVVVFCHSFGEERNRSYRSLVEFSRLLSAHGISSLRFDYFGSGESDGRMHHATVKSHKDDTLSAIKLAKLKFPDKKIILAGLRYGAVIAALTASESKDISDLLLLCPIIKGKQYWRELMRVRQLAAVTLGQPALKSSELLAELEANGVLEIEAQLIGKNWVIQYQEIDLIKVPFTFTGNIRLTRLKQDSLAKEQLEKVAQNQVLEANSVKIWSDEESDYWSNLALYNQQIPQQTIDATINWIKQMEAMV